MDLLAGILVICVIIGSALAKNAGSGSGRSGSGPRRNSAGTGAPFSGGGRRTSGDSGRRAFRAAERFRGSRKADAPIGSYGTSSDWNREDRRPGEDELEALIRQNHAYEEELKKLLAVREER